MRTALLLLALLFGVFLCACVVQDQADPSQTTVDQGICNPDNDDCPGGHPITREAALAETGDWEQGKLSAAGHPDTAYSTSCTKSGNAWTCTSKGDPMWPNWPGGSSHWIESTCEISTSGGSCYSLDCYYGGDGGKYCSPV